MRGGERHAQTNIKTKLVKGKLMERQSRYTLILLSHSSQKQLVKRGKTRDLDFVNNI